MCKEEGLFENIHDQDIPDYILRSKFEHFIDHELLEQKLVEGKNISKQLLEKMPRQLPNEYIDFYYENFVLKKG